VVNTGGNAGLAFGVGWERRNEGAVAMRCAERNGASGSESNGGGRADVQREAAHKRRKSQRAGARIEERDAPKNWRRQNGRWPRKFGDAKGVGQTGGAAASV
jgi:hypothetical protein